MSPPGIIPPKTLDFCHESSDGQMDIPVLVASRWRIGDFIFVEYLKGDGVFIDIGPFPQNPDDAQTDQVYGYLVKSKLDFLSLGELEWVLDLNKLSESIPQFKPESFTGRLSHSPAFETTSLPAPTRYFNKQQPATGFYFLRIAFEFQDSQQEPEEPGPPEWEPPKIIS